MTSGGDNFNHFSENELAKFSSRNAGDFSDAAGEREMAPKYGSLPRDVGDLVGPVEHDDTDAVGEVHSMNP